MKKEYKVSELTIAFCEGRTQEMLFPNSNIPTTLIFKESIEKY